MIEREGESERGVLRGGAVENREDPSFFYSFYSPFLLCFYLEIRIDQFFTSTETNF